MGREERSADKTAEIKRLVASGRYRVDPVAVADAIIRRGNWVLGGSGRSPLIVQLPRSNGDQAV